MAITPFAERTFDAPSQDEYYDRDADVIRTGAWFRPLDRNRGDWSVDGWGDFRYEATSPAMPVTMTVRDFASGETAEIPLNYYLYFSDSIGDHLYGGTSFARAVLGANVYEFRADASDDNAMYVSVTTATAATPEPATLLLAGVGLVGAAARHLPGAFARNNTARSGAA